MLSDPSMHALWPGWDGGASGAAGCSGRSTDLGRRAQALLERVRGDAHSADDDGGRDAVFDVGQLGGDRREAPLEDARRVMGGLRAQRRLRQRAAGARGGGGGNIAEEENRRATQKGRAADSSSLVWLACAKNG